MNMKSKIDESVWDVGFLLVDIEINFCMNLRI